MASLWRREDGTQKREGGSEKGLLCVYGDWPDKVAHRGGQTGLPSESRGFVCVEMFLFFNKSGRQIG